MQLTEAEINEISRLMDKKRNRSMPMLQPDMDRLEYLRRKQFVNCCINPTCEGFEGNNSDVVCPKCGQRLLKKND